jgi:hypothetical protein
MICDKYRGKNTNYSSNLNFAQCVLNSGHSFSKMEDIKSAASTNTQAQPESSTVMNQQKWVHN